MNPYEVLGIAPGADDAAIRAAYRALALATHPDHHPGHEDRFRQVTAAYELLTDPIRKAHYDRTGRDRPWQVASKKGTYYIEGPAGFKGRVADFHHAIGPPAEWYDGTRILLKVAKSPRDNDLLENEAKVLQTLLPLSPGTVLDPQLSVRLPVVVDALKLNDGKAHRQGNFFLYQPNFVPLTQVLARSGPGLALAHPVWMMNRALETLAVVHEAGYVHGAVLPQHILVYAGPEAQHPHVHGGKLIDWTAAVPLGARLKIMAAGWEKFYPPEVLAKKPATAATDLYLWAASYVYLLGGIVQHRGHLSTLPDSRPRYLEGFLRGCLLANPGARPQSAAALSAELTELLEKMYGPKRYVRFDLPAAAGSNP